MEQSRAGHVSLSYPSISGGVVIRTLLIERAKPSFSVGVGLDGPTRGVENSRGTGLSGLCNRRNVSAHLGEP